MRYLKAKIEEILLELCENVFLENAEDDCSFPYLVYDLKNGVHNQGQIFYFLDVDVWDKSETTETIDELSSKLKKLDKTSYIDENIQFTMHFDRLLNSKSEHKELKRYTMIFEVRAIERS